ILYTPSTGRAVPFRSADAPTVALAAVARVAPSGATSRARAQPSGGAIGAGAAPLPALTRTVTVEPARPKNVHSSSWPTGEIVPAVAVPTVSGPLSGSTVIVPLTTEPFCWS